MGIKRKAFQGVYNIIRFNWHFYVIVFFSLIALTIVIKFLPAYFHLLLYILCLLTTLSIIVSLLVSYYIYDLSPLYEFNWLPNCNNKKVLNINAGFDETSELINSRYPETKLSKADFYDPQKHTEVSIRRARAAYPPPQDTITVTTTSLPFKDNHFDICLATFAAHEIRNEQERIQFFKELNRVTKDDGEIFVTEHLRDFQNFIAYNIGFLHFHSRSSWNTTFEKSNLELSKEIKNTTFISTFILNKNGTTS